MSKIYIIKVLLPLIILLGHTVYGSEVLADLSDLQVEQNKVGKSILDTCPSPQLMKLLLMLGLKSIHHKDTGAKIKYLICLKNMEHNILSRKCWEYHVD